MYTTTDFLTDPHLYLYVDMVSRDPETIISLAFICATERSPSDPFLIHFLFHEAALRCDVKRSDAQILPPAIHITYPSVNTNLISITVASLHRPFT
jgi:hypothetical protein